MRKKIILLLLVAAPSVFAQPDTLQLSTCIKLANDSFPTGKSRAFYDETFALKLANVKTNWYPTLNLNIQATYQSEAMKIDLPQTLQQMGVSLPSASKDQYKALVEINQTIYDGGTTRSQKKYESASHDVDLQQVETSLYKLKEQVCQTYFQILVLQESRKQLVNAQQELRSRLASIESKVSNHVLIQSDYDQLKAEIIKLDQQLFEADANKEAALQILSELLGQPVNQESIFSVPNINITTDLSIMRPEDINFDLQLKKFEASQNLLKTQRYPKLYAFAQLGYGKPGLNYLNDDFKEYYVAGIGLKWNIWDWGKNKRDRQILGVQGKILSNEREVYDKNMRIMLRNQMAAIAKYMEFLNKDTEIVNLRSSITKTAASQLQNGAITTSEYITQLSAETQARINTELHRILLLQAKTNYLLTKGTF
jgi:outer membrane protein TolC